MDYAAARTKMVDNQIRTTDVTSHAILSAFLSVPRESFVPDRLKALAYIDSDLEVAPCRYVMEPSPLAKLLQLAEIGPSDNVLEIACGTGYATAIISEVAGSVTAIDSDSGLVEAAKANLGALGKSNVKVVATDMEKGHAADGPYDLVFINGAVEIIPEALFQQLKDGGRLVAVVGYGLASCATIFVKGHGHVSERRAFNTSVQPLPGFRKAAEFVF